MGLQVLQSRVFDGDFPLDVTNAQSTYFGGQALRITGTGISLATGDLQYIGVAKNSRYEDALNGKATVMRAFRALLINGSDQVDNVVNNVTVEGIPYDNSKTYSAGDLLYIESAAPNAGLWVNVATLGSPATATAKGIVIRPPVGADDSMEAYFFDVA